MNKQLKKKIDAWWEATDNDKSGYIFIPGLIKQAKLDLLDEIENKVVGKYEITGNLQIRKNIDIDTRNTFREEQREILKTMREKIDL